MYWICLLDSQNCSVHPYQPSSSITLNHFSFSNEFHQQALNLALPCPFTAFDSFTFQNSALSQFQTNLNKILKFQLNRCYFHENSKLASPKIEDNSTTTQPILTKNIRCTNSSKLPQYTEISARLINYSLQAARHKKSVYIWIHKNNFFVIPSFRNVQKIYSQPPPLTPGQNQNSLFFEKSVKDS